MENQTDKIMLLLIAMARLNNVDPKELGKEISNMKGNAEYMSDMTGAMVDKLIDGGVDKKYGETLKKIHSHIKGDLNKAKYKDKDEGFKR